MKKYPLVLLSLVVINSSGQVTFQKTYGGYKEETMLGLAATYDGGYALAGGSASFGDTTGDAYLIKTDSKGNKLWSKIYRGALSDHFHEVIETADHGLLLCGQTSSFGAGATDAFLMKTDSLGNLQWSKVYGGLQDDFFLNCRQTYDGGYIAVGSTTSFGQGDWDMLIVRLSASGDTLWTRILGGAAFDQGTDIIQTPDSNFVLTGRTYSYSYGYPDGALFKINQLGDTLWSYEFGGAGQEEAMSLKQTRDGGYIVTGSSNSFTVDYDAYLNRFDSTGHLLWSKTYGGSKTDATYNVLIMSDSGFALLGFTNSFNPVFSITKDGSSPSLRTEGDDSSNVYVIRTDANGDTLWTREYGGLVQDESYGFIKAPDDGLVILGYSSSFGITGNDAYLIRTNASGSSGCYERATNSVVTTRNTIVRRAPYHVTSGISIGTASFSQIVPATSSHLLCYFVGLNEYEQSGDLLLYPDPARQELNIHIPFLHSNSTLTVSIINILGQNASLQSIQWEGADITIDITKLSSGIYFVKVLNEDMSWVRKFVKE